MGSFEEQCLCAVAMHYGDLIQKCKQLTWKFITTQSKFIFFVFCIPFVYCTKMRVGRFYINKLAADLKQTILISGTEWCRSHFCFSCLWFHEGTDWFGQMFEWLTNLLLLTLKLEILVSDSVIVLITTVSALAVWQRAKECFKVSLQFFLRILFHNFFLNPMYFHEKISVFLSIAGCWGTLCQTCREVSYMKMLCFYHIKQYFKGNYWTNYAGPIYIV